MWSIIFNQNVLATRDLLVALRYSLVAVRCPLAAVRNSSSQDLGLFRSVQTLNMFNNQRVTTILNTMLVPLGSLKCLKGVCWNGSIDSKISLNIFSTSRLSSNKFGTARPLRIKIHSFSNIPESDVYCSIRHSKCGC